EPETGSCLFHSMASFVPGPPRDRRAGTLFRLFLRWRRFHSLFFRLRCGGPGSPPQVNAVSVRVVPPEAPEGLGGVVVLGPPPLAEDSHVGPDRDLDARAGAIDVERIGASIGEPRIRAVEPHGAEEKARAAFQGDAVFAMLGECDGEVLGDADGD